MKELFRPITPKEISISDQEKIYTAYYEKWYCNQITTQEMKERFIVNKDPKNCEECYFLNKEGFVPPRCLRLDQPIYQVDTCLNGPMIQKPETIDEVIAIGNALLVKNKKKK